jgi:citrate lyase subunit beta/citryl-CoA lyase
MSLIPRSHLFVPGDRPDRFDKAAVSGAHEVILDLEDAVAPAAKTQARDAVFTWLAAGKRAVVRINAADTDWYAEDMELLRALSGATVMLPKADAESVAQTVEMLSGRPIIALLETASAFMDLERLATTPGVARMAFGSVDFSADTGIVDEGDALTAVRTQIVMASRYAGLVAPIDGVSVEFTNVARMEQEALRSHRLGFGGKLCIHPRQVAAIHAMFKPSPQERSWATRVLAAFDASHGAATALDGKMIDKPVVERARRIVLEADAA